VAKAAAVQRHERAQLRRKHRNNIQNHHSRICAALAESFQHLEALGELDPLCSDGSTFIFSRQLFGELVDFDRRSNSLMASAPILAHETGRDIPG